MKKYKPKVSIIINCFNGELFLEKCLLSIFRQSYKNWEIIFWDNCSTDNSKNIFFQKIKNKKFKYFKAKKFTNLYAARNLAIKKAKGEIIMFVDVDDEWFPNKIKKQVSIFSKEKKINMIFTNFIREKNILFYKYKKKNSRKKLKNFLSVEDFLKFYPAACSSIALRKKGFNLERKLFNENLDMISDYDLVIRHAINNKIYCINDPLLLYREHTNQLSRQKFIVQINQFLKWYKGINKNNNFIMLKNFHHLTSKKIFLNNLKDLHRKKNIINLFKKIKGGKDLKSKIKLIIFFFFPKIFINYFIST